MPERFVYEAPNWIRMIWYLVRYQKRSLEHCRPWITDHHRQERYQLSADEDLMLGVLHDNIRAVKAHPITKLDWTRDKTFAARDHVLEAISASRHGDSTQWDKLARMSPDEWITWLRSLQKNPPPSSR